MWNTRFSRLVGLPGTASGRESSTIVRAASFLISNFASLAWKVRLFEFQSIEKLQPTTTGESVDNNGLELCSSDSMIKARSGEIVSVTGDLRIKANANDKQLLQPFGVGVPVKNQVNLPPVLIFLERNQLNPVCWRKNCFQTRLKMEPESSVEVFIWHEQRDVPIKPNTGVCL